MAKVKSRFNNNSRIDNNGNKESIVYFMENLDDPEAIFNQIWFLWNNTTPNFRSIQVNKKDDIDDRIRNMEAHNFELGLIQLSKLNPPSSSQNKIPKILKNKRLAEDDNIDSQESKEENSQENNNENVPVVSRLPVIEEEFKDNDVKETKDDELIVPNKQKPNSTAKLTVATKSINARTNIPPDSPLPVILINSKDEGSKHKGNSESHHSQEEHKGANEEADRLETDRHLKVDPEGVLNMATLRNR